MIRIALLLISLPLLAHGGEGLYLAARSRAQTHLTCAQFFAQRPRSGWVRVSGCEVDYVRAGYREARGRITELLFPLRPAGSSPAVPAALVLSTRDPEVLAIAEQTIGGAARADQDTFLVMMLKIVTVMRASRQVEGVTRTPLEMLRTRGTLSAIRAPLDNNFAILDLHARPRLLLPAIEAAAGAHAFLVFLFFTTAGRRLRPEIASLETVHREPPVSVVRAIDAGSLKGIMLLNLAEAATPADIEAAPPLGSQAEARARFVAVFPGLIFDNAGRATFTRVDVSVAIDLSSAAVVYTAVLDLAGDGAERMLHRVLSQTGWRAFSPRRGVFL
ncbi:MAG TPA: hypothetical protein VNJ03_03105 [Vicinamibacterales bacterium]|nr:hypothetical protein [Vicinamibacterales bacterium]